MKESFWGIFLLLILSCCTAEDASNTLSYAEIGADEAEMPKTEPQKTTKIDSSRIDFETQVFYEFGGPKVDSIKVLRQNEVLDRGETNAKNKLRLYTSGDSISFKEWSYTDTTALTNGFYNLLDCFGTTCESIELYDTTFITDTYHLVFISEYSVQWIASNTNQDAKAWLQYLNHDDDKQNFTYIFEQKVQKPSQWFSEEEYEFTQYKHQL